MRVRLPRALVPLALATVAWSPRADAQARRAEIKGVQAPPLPWQIVGTFSILGLDPATGEIGAAVQSRVFSVGNGVIWAEAGVGATSTQAVVDVSYGPQALEAGQMAGGDKRGMQSAAMLVVKKDARTEGSASRQYRAVST